MQVENFSEFVDDLVTDIAQQQSSNNGGITHILDFGSGQAYLSRTLARKYNHHVVGIESRTANIEGAREMDTRFDNLAKKRERKKKKKGQRQHGNEDKLVKEKEEEDVMGGSLQYIEKRVEDGNLREVVSAIRDMGVSVEKEVPQTGAYNKDNSCTNGECEETSGIQADKALGEVLENEVNGHDKRLLLISLHSCGNLVHHAMKAFIATPEVKAIALIGTITISLHFVGISDSPNRYIGCCYNLMTEKLGPTYKPPYRTKHPRLIAASALTDPHGFPLSNLFITENLSLNITARMMACQAPQNWTKDTSAAFFTRHFFRALLQRIFADKGLLPAASSTGLGGAGAGGEPIIIGSLRKKCYESFPSYVFGAMDKLGWEGKVQVTEEEIYRYEERFTERKKDLSVLWCLMAFCAGVVESLVVVDRYMYLCEEGVRDVWVEAAFEYAESPRNLVVVGVR